MNNNDERPVTDSDELSMIRQALGLENELSDETSDEGTTTDNENTDEVSGEVLEEGTPEESESSDSDGSDEVEEVYQITVNGEEHEVPLSELIDNYTGKMPWTKKYQELAEERKAFEAEKMTFGNKEKERIVKELEPSLREFVEWGEFLDPRKAQYDRMTKTDWANLRRNNINEYIRADAEYKDILDNLSRGKETLKRLKADAQKESVERELADLRATHPEFVDPVKGPEHTRELVRWLSDNYQVTVEEFAEIASAKQLRMLLDLKKAKETRQEVKNKVVKITPTGKKPLAAKPQNAINSSDAKKLAAMDKVSRNASERDLLNGLRAALTL